MIGKRFRSDERGVTMLEFAAIAPLFFALFLGIVEMGLAFYWWKSVEKAAHLGARIAIVRDAAVAVPPSNTLAEGSALGQPCRLDPSPCEGFDPVTCTGAACTGAGFAMILARMQSVFPLIEAENVTVSYEYIGLGFAGGPTIPAVSVTVSGVEFPFFILGQVFALFADDANAPAVIPDIRATLTGEDMAT